MPSRSISLALCTLALSTNPWVSISRCRFLPLTFLPPSSRARSATRSFPRLDIHRGCAS